MPYKNFRKALHKIKQTTENLTMPSTTPVSKHVNRKAILAATSILIVVVLGATILTFGSNKLVAYAYPVKGLGVGIYWDQTCTNRTLALVWGVMEPGSNNTLIIYVKNEGNSPASLALETSNWTPSAAVDYMTLNWNYSGQVLNVNQVVSVELTLTVDPTIKGVYNFSFETSITTSEH